MPRRSKLTMDDVAREAGVSKQTVSAVINNKSGISEETRARIRNIIARLDYHSFTVGVVIPSITNPFYPELVRGIEDEAQRHGYSLFLCNSDEDPQKEINYLHLLRRHRITGLIAANIPGRLAWTEALKNLAAQGVAVVVIGDYRPSEKVVQVTIDEEAGFVKATSHLLDLGHERVGMILPPQDHPDGQSPRTAGFLRAHAQRGKAVAVELLVPGGWRITDGKIGAAQLMGLAVPPTAIVAPNDMAAIGAITKLKELNRRVPEDVAVTGFDNIDSADWYDPALTTVDQPHYQMGQRAMQELLKRLGHPGDLAEVVAFETTLVVRRSSGGSLRPSPSGNA